MIKVVVFADGETVNTLLFFSAVTTVLEDAAGEEPKDQ